MVSFYSSDIVSYTMVSFYSSDILYNGLILLLGHWELRNDLTSLSDIERITKKRTKNKAKTTKPDSEWKRL
ncbi:hypothetical protein Tco_0285129 [Tanacetum coccineum]